MKMIIEIQYNEQNLMTKVNRVSKSKYYDSKGKEIHEYNLLKIFHFIGVNEQGRGRKKYYMYKWVRYIEKNNQVILVALHMDKNQGYVPLNVIADKSGIIPDSEIVQQINQK